MNFDEKDGFNLNDLARRLANIIRLGQIFAINYEAAKARVKIGDLVLIVAGSPPGIPGSINAMRVHKIGDAVTGVAPAYRK